MGKPYHIQGQAFQPDEQTKLVSHQFLFELQSQSDCPHAVSQCEAYNQHSPRLRVAVVKKTAK